MHDEEDGPQVTVFEGGATTDSQAEGCYAQLCHSSLAKGACVISAIDSNCVKQYGQTCCGKPASRDTVARAKKSMLFMPTRAAVAMAPYGAYQLVVGTHKVTAHTPYHHINMWKRTWKTIRHSVPACLLHAMLDYMSTRVEQVIPLIGDYTDK